ncbi:hypothetical protein QBC35DRAFT_531857 [Podospora australis]|uniref:Uncharacterized protein n=1 Tax=Podospora australis TaxID=1536484 RepID=A0AAN6WYB4_9PEZI|nr:hypothetical protein QBC35DRAFT_531857 [Podospora australis]
MSALGNPDPSPNNRSQAPAGQFTAGLETNLSAAAELSEEQRRLCSVTLCDDLIIKVHEAVGIPDPDNVTDAVRNRLWALVFERWDNCPINHPGAIRGRSNVESRTQRRRNSGQAATTSNSSNPPQTKPERMAGAPAFMKPSLNSDDFGISFQVCDSKGASAKERFSWQGATPLLPEINQLTLHLYFHYICVPRHQLHWDEAEFKRAKEYNMSLLVYWARSYLVSHLRGQDLNTTESKTDELVKLAEMRLLLDDSEAISAERGVIRTMMEG